MTLWHRPDDQMAQMTLKLGTGSPFPVGHRLSLFNKGTNYSIHLGTDGPFWSDTDNSFY